MKLETVSLVAILAALVVASSSVSGGGDNVNPTSVQQSARARFVMPKLLDFAAFRVQFKKHYANGAELARRTKLFMARVFAVFISSFNYMHKLAPKFLKITSRSDCTPEEREASKNHVIHHHGLMEPMALLPDPSSSSSSSSSGESKARPMAHQQGHMKDVTELRLFRKTIGQFIDGELDWSKQVMREFIKDEPDGVYLDYRRTQCFVQPKDQGKCGSCYLFSSIALMEYHHCRQTNKLVPFSEQYAIDCGRGRTKYPEHFRGCNGGFETVAGVFHLQHGLELGADYPYRAMEGSCPDLSDTKLGHIRMDKLRLFAEYDADRLTAEFIEQLLEKEGPLFISIDTNEDFEYFGGGVDVLNCDMTGKNYHSMVLVGHGIEDGLEYWLIRNSYGLEYGLEGHYKMAKVVKKGCLSHVGYMKGNFKPSNVFMRMINKLT